MASDDSDFEEVRDIIGFLRRHKLQKRKPKRVLERPDYFKTLEDDAFKRRFRLKKQTVRQLLSMIEKDIQAPSEKNRAVTPDVRLLATLRFYATGSFLITAADFMGISEASLSVIVALVTKAIANLWRKYIVRPSGREIPRIMEGFFRIAQFPRVVGTIDCTHIRIQSPGGEEAEYYRNRKDFFSFNVQTLCDHELKIRDLVARWPGSTHDQQILNYSDLLTSMQRGDFGNGVILGDGGYACQNFLLTPLLNPATDAELRYNDSHKQTRNTVERQYGLWKRRWPILRSTIRLHKSKVQGVIFACAVLHNLAIEEKDGELDDSDDDDDGDLYEDDPSPSSNSGGSNAVRNEIIAWFGQRN